MESNHVLMRNVKKLVPLSNDQQVSYDHNLSSQSTSSSSVIGNNSDILEQLLVYLPKKSLDRFKCVSKQWSSLISDEYFIQQHRRNRKNRHRYRSIQGMFLRKYWLNESGNNKPEFEFFTIDHSNVQSSSKALSFADDQGGIEIEQSCNGLLLCSSFGIEFDTRTRKYYVYNPTTGQYTFLPRSQSRSKPGYESCYSVSLAFNPFKSPHYKVICMSKNEKADECQIEIYYSETCTWKLIGYSSGLTNVYGCGVYWNGLLNWHNVHDSLVYFDIDTKLIGAVPMPDKSKNSLYFGACKGRLYYVETDCIGWANVSSLSIFEMKTDCTGWNVVYHVNLLKLRLLVHLHLENYCYSRFDNNELKVLLIDGEEREDEEEEESPKLVFQIWDKVISYDLKDGSLLNDVHDIEPVFIRGRLQQCRIFHAYQYIKSFASV